MGLKALQIKALEQKDSYYMKSSMAHYAKQAKIADAFEPLKDLPESYSGNCYSDLVYDHQLKKCTFKKDVEMDDTRYAKYYECFHVPMVLYQLLSLYQCTVHSHGQEGYKVTWEIALRHKATGQVVIFREWKGSFSLGCDDMFNAQVKRDLSKLLTLMVNGEVLHPYDGHYSGK